MTVGDRIKYLRKQRGMSQNQLAQAIGVHVVSIKRYEADKMNPQPAQIERLLETLGVGSFALSAVPSEILEVKDDADIVGLIITLCKAGILQITGERDSENKIVPETAELQCCYDATRLFKKLVEWEKVNYLYQQTVAAAGELPQMANEFLHKNFEETLWKTELELQRK